MNLLPVHVEGTQFKTSDGKPFKAIGCSDFGQFKRFLWPGINGWDVLVKPILDERRNLAQQAGYEGPLVARVFRYASPTNAFGINPRSYSMSQVTEFTQRLGEENWYVDWTCGDSQIVLPNPHGPNGQQQHLNEFCAALETCQNAFIVQTSNEPFQNGVNTTLVKPPKWGTYLVNSGMYYHDNWNHATDLEVLNLHTARSDDENHTVPKYVGKVFESAVYMTPRYGKPVIFDEGIGADEQNIPGRRCNHPQHFAEMGLGLGLVNGMYFHSTPGLASDGFGPVVKECWKAFIRGAKAGASI